MSFTDIKTPGVYVKELSLFPPSVTAVATAIPAFIGYTEKAIDSNNKAIKEPKRIKSLVEYIQFFGEGFTPDSYMVSINKTTLNILNITTEKRFHLFDSVRQYFDNGGGACYILPIGNFSSSKEQNHFINAIKVINKFDEPTLLVMPDAVELQTASNEADIDAFAAVQIAALEASAKMQDRFAILDIMEGFKAESITAQPVKKFRDKIGINNLKYGAAYYPWLITTYDVKVSFRQLQFKDEADADMSIAALLELNVTENEKKLLSRLEDEIKNSDKLITFTGIEKADLIANKEVAISKKLNSLEAKVKNPDTSETDKKIAMSDYLDIVQTAMLSFIDAESMNKNGIKREVEALKTDENLQKAFKTFIAIEKNEGTLKNVPDNREDTLEDIYDAFDDGWLGEGVGNNFADIEGGTELAGTDNIFEKLNEAVSYILLKYASLISNVLFYENQATTLLFAQHSIFKSTNDRIREYMRTMPPSGAIAGIYAFVDGSRGVWKAPANVSLNSVVGPSVKLDNQDQDLLNIHDTGKSINALRSFTGKGTLVWGARTLAGNDNEWRYVSVRRFFNMVEESLLKATNPFVFENNDANTWTKVKVMIENFLTLQWRAGALQGAKPGDAFFVHVGLGSTMTANDVQEGRMIVEVGMAVVRPAEFIILRFSHKMVEA